MIQRPDVEELLRRPGDYLLRKTDNTANQTRLALSVYWTDQVRHFIVQEAGNDVFFEESGHHEQDVEALVRWYERRNRPITQQSGVRLRRAVPREEWILTHESIKLGKKIGAGQFGEVTTSHIFLRLLISPPHLGLQCTIQSGARNKHRSRGQDVAGRRGNRQPEEVCYSFAK